MSLREQYKLPITCPNCGRKYHLSMSEIEEKKKIDCDCGTTLVVDEKQIKSLGEKFDELERRVRQIGGNIRVEKRQKR
jgi:hypothetical protein